MVGLPDRPLAWDTPTVYLVLPAYNEEVSLPALLPRVKSALEGAGIPYHVIVVNDGSADRTRDVARQHGAQMPLTIVDHERNQGLGAALKSGLLKASGLAQGHDVIVTMDADNTHPPDLILAMLGRVQDGYDLVVASRFVDGGQQVGLPFHRRVLSRTAGILLKTLFPVPGVTDYTCGFRAYRASVLKAALDAYGPSLVQERGFSCFVEVLLKLRTLGALACQVPLVLRYDFKESASKLRIMRTLGLYGRLIATNLVLPGTKPFRTLGPGSTLASRVGR